MAIDPKKLIRERRPVLDVHARDVSLGPEDLPLLVTGIAGVSGYNAFYHFREKYGDQVVGLRRFNNWPLQGAGMEPCDLDDWGALSKNFEKHRFKTIVNCGGSCALKACELDPPMAHKVNVTCVENLIRAADLFGSRFVHLSIDLVFSGKGDGGHVEEDAPDPVTVYGKTMLAAEKRLMDRLPEVCILRISLPMGISFNNHAGAIDWIQSRFAKGKPATLYFDEVRTPTYVECLNEVIEEVIVKRVSGLYHAGGTRRLSLYQIAQIVNRVGGYDPDLLIGCPRIDAGPMPPRAGNVTMESSKLAAALSRQPFVAWPLDQGMLPGDNRDWHYERKWGGNPVWTPSASAIVNQLYRRPHAN